MKILETKTEKEIARRRFLGLLGKVGLVGLGMALPGLSGCGGEKEPVKKEHPIEPVAKPEVCESETRLELAGRFNEPAIYCKDKENRQVACSIDKYESGDTYTTCYVLKE